ncbi:MAG: hypothetical protein ISS28_05260 [Candidatus Cloacimonetes bacterium]|nr:hypothetical protein [Candidatus Cloacimonadota bacterium]
MCKHYLKSILIPFIEILLLSTCSDNNGSITVLAPNGGEEFESGDEIQIRWSSSNSIEYVSIDFSLDGGSTYSSIISYNPNSGIYNWTVPYNVSTEQGLIKISDTKDYDIFDISNDFFIVEPWFPKGDWWGKVVDEECLGLYDFFEGHFLDDNFWGELESECMDGQFGWESLEYLAFFGGEVDDNLHVSGSLQIWVGDHWYTGTFNGTLYIVDVGSGYAEASGTGDVEGYWIGDTRHITWWILENSD